MNNFSMEERPRLLRNCDMSKGKSKYGSVENGQECQKCGKAVDGDVKLCGVCAAKERKEKEHKNFDGHEGLVDGYYKDKVKDKTLGS